MHTWFNMPSLVALALAIGCLWAPAATCAATLSESDRVALIPGAGGQGPIGVLPTTGSVAGIPADSFDEFSFAGVDPRALARGSLSGYDTVVLNQLDTSTLSPDARRTLSDFVSTGGKLIIRDADQTLGNDYSWLPVPMATGRPCPDCGLRGGVATVVEDNSLVSGLVGSPSYLDLAELSATSDAVGDANVIVDADPRWAADIRAITGGGQAGVVHAYASDGGLIVYDGFDIDSLGSEPVGSIDWGAKLWYQELRQAIDPDGLPGGAPLGPPPKPGGAEYVAMGDSYSAGEGLAPFRKDAPDCHRSQAQAYATLVTEATPSLGSPTFVACTGATTQDVFEPQSDGHGGNKQPAQMMLLRQGSGPNTQLVTFTFGGNDAGFATVLQHCVLLLIHHCRQRDFDSVAQALTRLGAPDGPGSLMFVIKQVHAAAPTARIIVGNYPRVFRQANGRTCRAGRYLRIPIRYRAKDVTWLNNAGDNLDKVIDAAVARARRLGIDIRLADAAPLFVGHGVNCDQPDDPDDWIHEITRAGRTVDPASMHPTAAGQQAYARAVQAVLR